MVQVGVESENGWRPARLDPGSEQLVWRTVPGTAVNLQVMRGLPEVFLLAWAADWNAYIEPLRDADSASYTPTNSVATSNHLNATAEDLNWRNHPFPQRGSLNSDQMATLRQMIDFYEGWIFWAGDWSDPVDEMHSQMGYNTWNRNTAALDFIARKIRSDGFSTFRRGPLPSDPPPPAAPTAPQPNPTLPDDAAQVLYDAVPVIDLPRAQVLAPAIRAGLALAQCGTVQRIAMWLAQIGHESDGFRATEEYAKNGRYAPYIGRTWIQITWQENYAKFGVWCVQQGLLDDADYFVHNPAALAEDRWAAIGPAWYWTVARPQINELSDSGDLLGVTKAINGGTNGLDVPGGRRERYSQALALGDRLLSLTAPTPTTTPEGPLMALTDDEQRELLLKTREVWDQLRILWPQLGDRTLVDAVATLVDRPKP